MAKAQEYKLSGGAEDRADDPRAQAIEMLSHRISANHPDIMKELAIAHAHLQTLLDKGASDRDRI